MDHQQRFRSALIGIFVFLSASCTEPAPTTTVNRAGDRSAAVADLPKVVFLGDSISAGLHLSADEAFPALLERRFASGERPFHLVNAGVSGDTTAGGMRRLDWLLAQAPDVLVIELGGNDGLRGVAVAEIEKNLLDMIRRVKERGVRVLVLGVRLPENYGVEYTTAFAGMFKRVCEAEEVAWVADFMKGVAGVAELNLEDGLHPNARGHELLADNVEAALAGVFKDAR